MPLRVNAGEITNFAEANDSVAGQVEAASQPDPSLIAQMQSGFGPVGAELTAAVEAFHTALQASGTAVAQQYTGHAENLRSAATGYVNVDASGADGVSGSTAV